MLARIAVVVWMLVAGVLLASCTIAYPFDPTRLPHADAGADACSLDLDRDPHHCGACGIECPGTTCASGSCTNLCRLGFLDCDDNAVFWHFIVVTWVVVYVMVYWVPRWV